MRLSAAGCPLGYLIGSAFAGTENEKQSHKKWGACIGAVVLAIFSIFKAINTLNYVLFHKGKRVYDGITRHNRLAKRLREHQKSGKHFDSCRHSDPTFRFVAREIERDRIRRFNGKYNIQHNRVSF